MLFIIEYFKLVPVTYVEDNPINIADIIYLIVQQKTGNCQLSHQ